MMGSIKIIEGDFPKQRAEIIEKSLLSKDAILRLKNSQQKKVSYILRSALTLMETIVEHRRTPTVKITLADYNVIIGKVDRKTFEFLKVSQSLGRDPSKPLFVEPFRWKPEGMDIDLNPAKHLLTALLLWLVSAIFLLVTAVMAVDGELLPTICFLGIGLLLFPPVRKKLKALNFEPDARSTTVLLVIFLGLAIFLFEGRQARELNGLRSEYVSNHDKVLEGMKAASAAGEFAKAVALGKPYERVAENEFSRVYWDSVAAADRETEKNRLVKLREEFARNRASILDEMKAMMKNKQYAEAKNLFDKYGEKQDAEFDKLGRQATTMLAKAAEKEAAAAIERENETIREQVKADRAAAFQKILDDGTLRAIAQTVCESAVRRTLKAPSTADFPWTEGRVVLSGPGKALFTSYVDAQNGFGAMIRTNYLCSIEFSGDLDDADDVNKWAVTGVSHL